MSLLEHDKFDVDYIHQDKIGGIIAEGLSVLIEQKPNRPIDYLAKWLLQHSQNQIKLQQFHEQQENKQELLFKQKLQQNEKEKQQLHIQDIAQQNQTIEDDFHKKIHQAVYHEELLSTHLCDFLKAQKCLTDVYVCKLDYPDVKVDLDNDDSNTSHQNIKANKIFKYIAASYEAKYLIGKQITVDQAIVTNQALIDTQTDINKRGIYINDVVQDPRIHYHRWPRLGAYYAIPLIYSSCLSEQSFDKGLDSRIKFQKMKQDQQKEIEDKRLELGIQDQDSSQSQDKLSQTALLQEFIEGLSEIQETPFHSVKKQYVICFDTLGQDRGISQEDRNYLLNYVDYFVKQWEEREMAELSLSIDEQIVYLRKQKELLIQSQNQDQEDEFVQNIIQDNMEYYEQLKQKNNEYQYEMEVLKLEYIKKQLRGIEMMNSLISITKRRVIKYEAVIQCAFYLLNYHKNDINYKGTNVLDWRKVRSMFNNLFIIKLLSYSHRDSKSKKPHPWAMINRIYSILEDYDQEEIENYNVAFGQLYKLLHRTCQLRKTDIEIRQFKYQEQKNLIIKLKQDRVTLEEEKNQALQEFMDELTEDQLQEFNKEEWLTNFDSLHIQPSIPDDPIEQIDLDYEFE